MAATHPKVYSQIIDLNESTQFESALMAGGYSMLQIDVDFFSDTNAENPVAATGTIVFKAQTTADSGDVSINQGTVDCANRDYDRPFANGRVVKVTCDMSPVFGAQFARVEIWRS